jgi:hypothetical protein
MMQTFTIDDATVSIESIGNERQPADMAYRQRYSYSIVTPVWRYDGDDIRSGCGADVDESDAARTLFEFLYAAAEAYRYEMNGGTSENIDLFPRHVTEWAYQNSDEISLLAMDA